MATWSPESPSFQPYQSRVAICFYIDSGDLFDVLEYLENKQGKCYEIGSALRLDETRLAKIQSDCPYDTARALRINDWLKKEYNTERHGPPTWKALVKAVKSPFAGDDPKLAEKIAKDHPSQPSGGKSSTHTIIILNNEEGRV